MNILQFQASNFVIFRGFSQILLLENAEMQLINVKHRINRRFRCDISYICVTKTSSLGINTDFSRAPSLSTILSWRDMYFFGN